MNSEADAVWACESYSLAVQMFTRILRSFQLPVGGSHIAAQQVMHSQALYDSVNTLLVSLLVSVCLCEYVCWKGEEEVCSSSTKAVHLLSLFATQGGDSKAQEHLTLLMVSIESFYHPSNVGVYSVS